MDEQKRALGDAIPNDEPRTLDEALAALRRERDRAGRSELRLAAAQRITRCGSWEMDLSDAERPRPTFWSDETFRVLGYEPGSVEVTAENFYCRVPPEDRAMVPAALKAAYAAHSDHHIEHRIIRPDGEERIVQVQSEIKYDEAGTPLRLIGTLQDVTDQRRNEEALRLSEARYRTHFEHAPEAISILDMDEGKWIDANSPAERLFGLPREKLFLRHPIMDFSPQFQPDGRSSEDAARSNIEQTLAGENPIFEWIHLNATGQEIPCEVRLVRVPFGDRRIVRASIIDIRERKRLEVLNVRSMELELQNRRIQEASRLKSEFLANMSHELRTPLNAIIGFAELLRDGVVVPNSKDFTEFLNDILSSGRHLLQLINDILDLSKIEAGKFVMRPEAVDAAVLVEEVHAVLGTTAMAKRIHLKTEVDPVLTDVFLDPARFKQVLYNYISNALKFTHEGGRVHVSVQAEGAHGLRLEVEDTGIGIEPRDIGRLFQEFEQLESGTTKRHPGTGLGLTLTKRLVEAQGGTVGVRSALGRGSTFHAIFPNCRPSNQPHAMKVKGASRVSRYGTEILVVEDDERDRALIVKALEEAGYSVESVSTGAEAIAVCQGRAFDAITLDLLLPDMSGLDVVASLRAAGQKPTVPIIVITVIADHRAMGGFTVHDFLQKPLRAPALLASLERANVKPDGHGSILVVDDDEQALRLMETTLANRGYRPICRPGARAGLEAVETLKPAAIILDLLMPEMDGFEFLLRLSKSKGRDTPVLIWTGKDLSNEETESLLKSARVVVAKGGGQPDSLLTVLRMALSETAGVVVQE